MMTSMRFAAFECTYIEYQLPNYFNKTRERYAGKKSQVNIPHL